MAGSAEVISGLELPVPLPGSARKPGDQRSETWPDGLSSRVLYRGHFFPAASPSFGRNARLLVTAALADWRLLTLADDVRLCASELVANAVQHADCPVTGTVAERLVSVGLRCWAWTDLFLEIGDWDSRMPKLLPQDDSAVAGRGLFMVRKLADELCWKREADGGKVVYARFGLRPGGVGFR